MQIMNLTMKQQILPQLWAVFYAEERHSKPYSATRVLLPAQAAMGSIWRMALAIMHVARELPE